MAEVKAFRGILYNAGVIGADRNKVYAPPYDVISPSMQDELYSRSQYNIVRLILGKQAEDDGEKSNKYTRAGELFNKWCAEGVLERDRSDAFYVYLQEYECEGRKNRRIGFIGLLKLDEPEKKEVLPHENTLLKPKEDRMNLIKQVRANLSPVFTLFPDENAAVTKTLESCISKKAPLVEVKEQDGVHMLWRVTDEKIKSKLSDLLKGKKIFIADGHHRYEVARNYRDMMRRGERYTGNEEYIMAYFTGMSAASDLTVMATHRVVKKMPFTSADEIKKKTSGYFDVTECGSVGELMEQMGRKGLKKHVFGYFGGGKYLILELKNEKDIAVLVAENKSLGWKSLDVSILHSAIFQKLLGVKNEEGNVVYTRDHNEAEELVKNGRGEAAFFLNPTRIEQLRAVAESGDMMPQKSTYFYPKLLSGLVINRFD